MHWTTLSSPPTPRYLTNGSALSWVTLMGGESSDDHTVRTRLPEIIKQVTTGDTFASLSVSDQTSLLKISNVVKISFTHDQ